MIPAFKARSLGFDSSMVAAYGQDDKVCAYTSLAAMMTLENVKIQQFAYYLIKRKLEVWEIQGWNHTCLIFYSRNSK